VLSAVWYDPSLYVCTIQCADEISQPVPPPESDSEASPPQRRRVALPQGSQRNGGESSAQGARRGRPRSPSIEQDDVEDELSGAEGMGATQGALSLTGELFVANELDSNKDRMIKKLVRYAISAEYTRVPIKRTEISSKGSFNGFPVDLTSNLFLVLGSHGRMFKEVFAGAQLELERVFGMRMVELPIREKTKLSQRRGGPNPLRLRNCIGDLSNTARKTQLHKLATKLLQPPSPTSSLPFFPRNSASQTSSSHLVSKNKPILVSQL